MGVTYRRGNVAAISRRTDVDVDEDGDWQEQNAAINERDDADDGDANDDE